jgi:acetyl-CoA carboxylase biotin carboxyl carrier protein
MSDDDARGKAQPADDAGNEGDGAAPSAGGAAEELVIEVDVAPDADPPALRDDGDVELLVLIDRLAALLDRSDLSELEVEAGGTGLVLRKPTAIAVPAGVAEASASAGAAAPPSVPGEPSTAGRDPATVARPSVKAPLTGIFYASPAPGSAPYVQVGGELAVGQIIGLIEAMKLFNEIKSDLAGRVVKVIPESGTLVKAKQPLVEVEPL